MVRTTATWEACSCSHVPGEGGLLCALPPECSGQGPQETPTAVSQTTQVHKERAALGLTGESGVLELTDQDLHFNSLEDKEPGRRPWCRSVS